MLGLYRQWISLDDPTDLTLDSNCITFLATNLRLFTFRMAILFEFAAGLTLLPTNQTSPNVRLVFNQSELNIFFNAY